MYAAGRVVVGCPAIAHLKLTMDNVQMHLEVSTAAIVAVNEWKQVTLA